MNGFESLPSGHDLLLSVGLGVSAVPLDSRCALCLIAQVMVINAIKKLTRMSRWRWPTVNMPRASKLPQRILVYR